MYILWTMICKICGVIAGAMKVEVRFRVERA